MATHHLLNCYKKSFKRVPDLFLKQRSCTDIISLEVSEFISRLGDLDQKRAVTIIPGEKCHPSVTGISSMNISKSELIRDCVCASIKQLNLLHKLSEIK